jgi:hypothetical protein
MIFECMRILAWMALAILSTVGACSDAPQDEEEVIPDCGSLSCEPEVLVRTEGLILPQTFKEYEGSLYWLDRNGKIFRFELADRRLTQIASVGPVDDGSADLAGLEVTADVVYVSVFTPIIYSVPISGGNLTAAFTDDDPVMSIIGYRDSLVWINQFGKIRKGDPDSLTSEELLDALDQGPSPLKIGGHHLYCSTVFNGFWRVDLDNPTALEYVDKKVYLVSFAADEQGILYSPKQDILYRRHDDLDTIQVISAQPPVQYSATPAYGITARAGGFLWIGAPWGDYDGLFSWDSGAAEAKQVSPESADAVASDSAGTYWSYGNVVSGVGIPVNGE